MAGARKVGEKIPLAVVGKDEIEEGKQEIAMTEEDQQSTISQLTENLKALRAQVDQLSTSLAHVGGKAGRAVAHGANAATDTVTDTVRTYPFYSVLAASAAAFLIGRMSVSQPATFSDRAYGQLRDALRMAGSRLPSNIADTLRSSMR
jgi:ElaB/YqjD/DUF883 family membrane-anchored ribosome-binding protein